jgi:hypothetical protein
MTNTVQTFTEAQSTFLLLAADQIEKCGPEDMSAEVAEFTAFLLRSFAHGRRAHVMNYRALQLARAITGEMGS